MYFVRYGGGVRCVPLVFLFVKSHRFGGGGCASRPPISQLYNVRLSEPLGDTGNKICPILVKQKSFFFKYRPLLLVLSIIITIISAKVLVAFYFA